MAKKCSTCKRPYPDHLQACPHCHPARAKSPADEDLVLEDIDLVAEEPSKPRRKAAPPPLPADDVPLEVVDEGPLDVAEVDEVQEVAEVEEVLDADDVLEVVSEDAAPAAGDSARGPVEQPSDVVDIPSDLIVVDQEGGADSSVKLDRPGQVVDLPSDLIVVDQAVAVEGPISSQDVIEVAATADPASARDLIETVDVVGPESGVIEVVDGAEPISASDLIEVVEPASGVIEIAGPASGVIEIAGPVSDVIEVAGPASGVIEVVETEEPVSARDVLEVADVAGPASSKDILEVVEEAPSSADDLLAAAEAEAAEAAGQPPPPPPAPPPGAAPTTLGRMPQPTKIAAKAPAPTMLAATPALTMLAGPEAAEELAAGPAAAPAASGPAAPPPPAAAPPSGAAPTKLGRLVQPTKIAGRAPTPTMLAESDAADELPGSELGGTPAARDLPRLELDSGKTPSHADVIEVVGPAGESDVIDVVGDEVLEVIEASPIRHEPPLEVVDSGIMDVFDVTEPAGAEVVEEIADVDAVEEVVEETVEFQPEGAEAPSQRKRGKNLSAIDLLGEDILVEGASEVDLGRQSAKGERPSGVDLIAEALESGVDLADEGPKSPPRTAHVKRTATDEEVEGEGVLDEDVLDVSAESSSVNLGAAALPGKGRKKGDAEALSDLAADALMEGPSGEQVAEVSDEAVEEVVEEVGDEAPSKKQRKVRSDEDVDAAIEESLFGEDEAAAAVESADEVVEEAVDEDLVVPAKGKGKSRIAAADEEAVDEDLVVPAKGKSRTKAQAAAAVDDEDDDRPSRRGRRERAGGGFLKFVATLLLGILLAGGGAAAVWYLKPDLLSAIPESPSLKGVKWQGIDKKDKVTPAQLAAAQLALGNYDEALKLAKGEDPDTAAVRGEARWQKYVKQQRDKDAPLDAKATPVEEAHEDLQKSSNKELTEEVDKTIKVDNALRDTVDSLKKADDDIRKALAKFNDKVDKADLKTVAKTAGDLVEAWQQASDKVAAMNKALVDAKLADKALKPGEFKDLVDQLAAANTALEETRKQLKVLKADEVPKKVAELDKDRKALVDKRAEVNAKLMEAGAKGEDVKGVQELAADRDALKGQKKELDAAQAQALEELKKGNFLPDDADPKKQLVAGARAARLKAESPLAMSLGNVLSSLSGLGGGAGKLLQRGLENTADKAQLAAAKVRQALSETPDQRLDTWLALFQGRARKDPQDVVSASKYLDWINSKESGAGAETRGKALFALGLAQRNNGQFADAAKTLKQALAAAAGVKNAPWAGSAKQVLQELTDPTAYFLPLAANLRQEGQLKGALAELDTGLQAIPGDGRLHALRALVRLELAGGKLDAATQEAVRQDAVAAQKDAAHAAQGYYAVGRLEEQQGHLAKAEQAYREAIKTHQGPPDEASLYRSALARLLLRDRVPGAEEPPAPKGKAPQTGRLQSPPRPDQAVAADARGALLVLLMTGVQVAGDEDEDPEVAARLKQATELAKELINSPNPRTKGEGYMILGQVYAKQSKRGEGILLYVKGLQLYYPGKETAELVKMVNEHPAFQQPDTMPRYSPLLAERHFGQGLEYFWQRRYPQAEAEFKQAVKYYDQDARYQYYLGLARYQQQTKAKREAARYDFGKAAQLEAQSRPHSYQVNASLERLQGEMRQVLDRYRLKSGGSQ